MKRYPNADLMKDMFAEGDHGQDLKADEIAIGGNDRYVRPQAMDMYEPPAPFDFDPSLYPLKGTFKEHQARGLAEANFKPGHCFFLDPGAGKTAMIIGEASGLFEKGLIDGVISLAPNGPHQQTIDEQFPLWCAVNWRGIHNKQGKREIDKFFDRSAMGVMGALGMNYDAMITDNGWKLIRRFMKKFPRIYLAIDESSKLKSIKAQRTLEVMKLARMSAYRRPMSGTPILKGVEDLYSQYDICEPGMTGHKRYSGFKSYYCIERPIPGARSAFAKQIVGYRNEEELKRRTAPYVTRVKSIEFRPEANPSFMRVSTPMKPDQERHYKSMVDTLMVELSNGTITVENALTRMAKLLQIASGYIIDEDTNVQWLSNNKINAVNSLLDELDEPVVMFAPFIALQDHLETALRERDDRPVFRYRSREDVTEWKKHGGVILGNQGSGLGIGQNLQMAAATIYAANNFSSEARWQSIKRTDRTGQERQCRFWDLVAPNTLESKVLSALDAKEELANRSIDDIRSYLQ